ncbi:MAG: hypothetical protein FJ390_04710 [Verrucomicrobia bacterium]|nr:hypothetical protein [Verrucomicrobiota bacterium]
MKLSNCSLLEKLSAAKFFIITLVVLGFLLLKESKFLQQQIPKTFPALTFSSCQKSAVEKSVHDTRSVAATSSKIAAPLNALSKQELQDFPRAYVVEAVEVEGPGIGQKTRERVLKTQLKYPYVRTEEVIDSASGALLHRTEMAATHLLVHLPEGENPQHFLSQLGPDATTLERVTSKDSLYRLQLGSHALATLPNVMKEIQEKQLSLVDAEPDYLTHALLVPNNPLYYEQWYLHQQCWQIEGPWDRRIFSSCINACDAWNLQTSAENVVVAVIDSGIRYTHEDLAANMWHEEDPVYGTINGWNFSVLDNDPRKSDPMDNFGHGTACAGIIGAVGNNGLGTVGIAWKVKLMAVKYYDQPGLGYTSDAVKAIDWACEHGAKILNCSWMSDPPKNSNNAAAGASTNGASTVLQAALSRARDQGVIVVAAAGNSGRDNDQNPIYPASYAHGYGFDNMISVGSTTEDDQLAEFSNFGATTVDIAAPGEEIFSTWARSDSDYITAETRKEILTLLNNGEEPSEDQLNKAPCGTSFSAPQVVGALALLKEKFPTWTYQQLIQRVINTSDPIPSPSEKQIIGGKLNVARALGDPIN